MLPFFTCCFFINSVFQQFNDQSFLESYLQPITNDNMHFNSSNSHFAPIQFTENNSNPYDSFSFQNQNFNSHPRGAPPPPPKKRQKLQPKRANYLGLPKNVISSINSNDTYLHESHNPFFRKTPGLNTLGGILSATNSERTERHGVNGKRYRQHHMSVKIKMNEWILTKDNPQIPKRDQLILRIFERSAAHKDYAPYGLEVQVNFKPQQIGEDIPVANTAQIPKPQPKCINLTNDSNIKTPQHFTSFDLKISWRKYVGFDTPDLSWSVMVASRQHVEDAAKSISEFDEVFTRKMIKSKFSGNLDKSGLGVVEMKCKLSCPLTLVKMLEYPVRFEKCKHVECFDAITYLKMNYKRPSQNSWKCPICQKHEPWETLKLCTV